MEAFRNSLDHDRPAMVEPTRTADVLVDVLVEAGVEVVFVLPGGAIAPINDALLDRPEIRVIMSRHESGAVFAAAAYARATGKVGVVMVTSGPGAINAMNGLASAHCDGLPVLLIAGEVQRSLHGKRALQEGTAYHLNICGMASHITKLALPVPDPNAAPAYLRRAIATAVSGRRGPVLLTIPFDVSSAKIVPPMITSEVGLESRVDPRALDRAVRALTSATRPAIFAGSGTRWGQGPQRLLQLAERLQLPVITTPKAKGVFPESHPLSLGVFGFGGHPSASQYLSEGIDTLLAVGCGMTDPATNGWSKLLTPSRHFIQIDVDAVQIGRNYPVTEGIVGPADRVLAQLVERLPLAKAPARRFGVTRFTDPALLGNGSEGLILPQRALWELQRAMPRNTIFTSDIGEHLLFAAHYIEANDPQSFLMMMGLGSMTTGISGAIGMKLALPKRPVVAIVGDGCFSMGLSDVHTAAQERLPLVIAVLNDQRYGMVELGHEAIYGRTPQYGNGTMDVLELARGVGAHALEIRHAGDILGKDLANLVTQGPLVLDIRIDRSEKMPKNNRFEGLARSAGARIFN